MRGVRAEFGQHRSPAIRVGLRELGGAGDSRLQILGNPEPAPGRIGRGEAMLGAALAVGAVPVVARMARDAEARGAQLLEPRITEKLITVTALGAES